MKCFRTFAFTLCALVTPCLAQTPPAPDVTVTYDKFKNVSTAAVTVSVAEPGVEGPPRIFLQAGYAYRGQRLRTRPRTYFVSVRVISRGLRFGRENSFIALVDGRRLPLKPLRRVRVNPYSEELEGSMTDADFRRLAAARKVELQLGEVEVELSPEALAALAALGRSAGAVTPPAR